MVSVVLYLGCLRTFFNSPGNIDLFLKRLFPKLPRCRVRPKPKLSGLNQVPTRNKVPGFGSWVPLFQASWFLVSCPVFNILEFTGNTRKLLVQPGNSWFGPGIFRYYKPLNLFSSDKEIDFEEI